MDGADGSRHYGDENLSGEEQSPSLLTIVLDTNPAAWSLLDPLLSISTGVANLLVFINAHLACNYTNQVAVVASHCDKAQWLYPTATPQRSKTASTKQREEDDGLADEDEGPTSRNKRLKTTTKPLTAESASFSESDSNKYRPYRLIEEELIRNLRNLMSSTSPDIVHEKSSTMIAGALSLALSYINRRSQEHQESMTGISSSLADQSANAATDPSSSNSNTLQARILIITLSPSSDLAHQYIPIMNSIFACQRLNIPIDVLQLPLGLGTDVKKTSTQRNGDSMESASRSSTVFLQQASDATHGIFVHAKLSPPGGQASDTSVASSALLTYLLSSFLPSPVSRLHLITPTRVDVDFRAACFCHRDIIPIGYVCSICLSIFCDKSLDVLDREGCLTCGTKLSARGQGVGSIGRAPIVVAPRKKKKKRAGGSAVGTPRPGTPG